MKISIIKKIKDMIENFINAVEANNKLFIVSIIINSIFMFIYIYFFSKIFNLNANRIISFFIIVIFIILAILTSYQDIFFIKNIKEKYRKFKYYLKYIKIGSSLLAILFVPMILLSLRKFFLLFFDEELSLVINIIAIILVLYLTFLILMVVIEIVIFFWGFKFIFFCFRALTIIVIIVTALSTLIDFSLFLESKPNHEYCRKLDKAKKINWKIGYLKLNSGNCIKYEFKNFQIITEEIQEKRTKDNYSK